MIEISEEFLRFILNIYNKRFIQNSVNNLFDYIYLDNFNRLIKTLDLFFNKMNIKYKLYEPISLWEIDNIKIKIKALYKNNIINIYIHKDLMNTLINLVKMYKKQILY
ncbi:hypothetical protein [Alphaentomopoxvirus acuprea]|uniref:Uncharacterized protein n=1 Tax=Alphaentomopoxvirus acuprea TaxID=62099 RepID=W6JPN6_9POXV|nr:hypothetical protein BA82_gp234 [Anomala cuprea entomopoxvirus]BAO49594.1 hypothetical protein [Anomala cuprea entomopoxvirus]